MSTLPAIAMLELDSIAIGTRVADAMIKRAPVREIRVGTVQPGKYLVLVGGSVAAVEEAHLEGVRESGDALLNEILLPNVHEQVYESLEGKRRENRGDALGILETSSLAANVLAADKAVKAADVTIVEMRLGDGLGGKGITSVTGKVQDVQAAIAAGVASVSQADVVVQSVVIPRQHTALRQRLDQSTRFFEGS